MPKWKTNLAQLIKIDENRLITSYIKGSNHLKILEVGIEPYGIHFLRPDNSSAHQRDTKWKTFDPRIPAVGVNNAASYALKFFLILKIKFTMKKQEIQLQDDVVNMRKLKFRRIFYAHESPVILDPISDWFLFLVDRINLIEICRF